MSFLTNTFSFIDDAARSPTVNWKTIMTVAIVGSKLFNVWVNARQYRVQCRDKPSKTAAEAYDIDEQEFRKSQDYSKANLSYFIFMNIFTGARSLLLVRYNVFSKLWYFYQPLVGKYLTPRWFGDTTISLLTAVTLLAINNVTSLPHEVYNTFWIEEKFGFNKYTPGLFFKDAVKKLLIGAVFYQIIYGGIQKIIEWAGDNFLVYLAGFFFVLVAAIILLFPNVIMPIFFNYVPLEEGELRTKLEELALRLKFPVSKIYVEDGSSRSNHVNAYFTGLPGFSKQIVLYDTLIKDFTVDEIVAIMAHELGHWVHNDMLTGLFFESAKNVLEFAPLSLFLNNRYFYESMGFTNPAEMPILAAVYLYDYVISSLNILVQLGWNNVSRYREYNADKFSVQLGYGDALYAGILKLGKKSLGAVDVDPIYSAFKYSHPHTTERLAAIKAEAKKIQ